MPLRRDEIDPYAYDAIMALFELKEAIMEEEARLEIAHDEILKLNDLEADLETTWTQYTLSAAQAIQLLSERRKLIELRANLSGALRLAPMEER